MLINYFYYIQSNINFTMTLSKINYKKEKKIFTWIAKNDII